MSTDRDRRLRGVRRLLRGVDGLLITDIVNVRYLTGFRGSSGFVLFTRTASIFVTDFRYELQAHREVAGFDVIIEKGNVSQAVRRLAKRGLPIIDVATVNGHMLKVFQYFLRTYQSVGSQ